jgi:hypothetical protein
MPSLAGAASATAAQHKALAGVNLQDNKQNCWPTAHVLLQQLAPTSFQA